MSFRTLERWSGGALLLGAALSIIAKLLISLAGQSGTMAQLQHPAWIPALVLGIVGAVPLLLGLPAVYARQAGRLGAFGLIAFVMVFVGFITPVGGDASSLWIAELASRTETRSLVEARVRPGALMPILMSGLLMLFLGTVTFGISVIRARVFAWQAGALLVGGLVLDIVGGIVFRYNVGVLLVYAGWAWLGMQLLTGRPGSQRVPHSDGAVSRAG